MHRLLERLGESSFERIFNQRLGAHATTVLIFTFCNLLSSAFGNRLWQERLSPFSVVEAAVADAVMWSLRVCRRVAFEAYLTCVPQWNVAVCAGYLLFKEFCEQCDEPVPQLQFYEEVRFYV